ncbi:MAG: IMPACT family protein [Schwartzia sp. (in: firmicutes)]
MPRQLVIIEGALAEYTVQRSRFIAETAAIADEDDAQAFLQAVKKKHYDARHHCYGWIAAGGRRKKSGDDGEPAGTAGAPILSALERQGVTEGIIVVTRYFGGIKLGTGGLTRAYAHAAALGLAASRFAERQRFLRVAVTIAYPFLGVIETYLQKHAIHIAEKTYGATVTLTLHLVPETAADTKKAIADRTAGQAHLSEEGEIDALLPLLDAQKRALSHAEGARDSLPS